MINLISFFNQFSFVIVVILFCFLYILLCNKENESPLTVIRKKLKSYSDYYFSSHLYFLLTIIVLLLLIFTIYSVIISGENYYSFFGSLLGSLLGLLGVYYIVLQKERKLLLKNTRIHFLICLMNKPIDLLKN
jgi:hypothetical protein